MGAGSFTVLRLADAVLAAPAVAAALDAVDRVRALLPRITELAEFEQEAERDATSILLVRDHLRRALGDQP
jgi:hypothetical protein